MEKLNLKDQFAQEDIKKQVEIKTKKAQQELEQEIIKTRIKETPQEINRKQHQEVVDDTLDLIFELITSALKIVEVASHGKTGMNHNMELMGLYNKVILYRRKFLSKYANVTNDDRLDLIQFKKDLVRTINSNSVKMRNPKTRNRMKNFRI